MSAAKRRTVVNGHNVCLWDCDESMPVRQFAAAVGRGHDAIRCIDTDTLNDVCVWLDDEPAVEHAARLPTPDGWMVDDVKATQSGGIAVKYNRVEQ